MSEGEDRSEKAMEGASEGKDRRERVGAWARLSPWVSESTHPPRCCGAPYTHSTDRCHARAARLRPQTTHHAQSP